MAMLVYANDYDSEFPRSGGKDTQWANRIPDWKANDRNVAYGLADDGSGGQGSITSCFYLLVKYIKERTKSFVCWGDSGAKAFDPADEGAGDRALTELWDFGSEPSKHCSYSYHMPFGQYALTTESEPDMAVAADRNPWQDSPAYSVKTMGFFNPDGGRESVKFGNANAHQEEVQNVLFVDCHVGQGKRSFCGINDDNIYTFWDGGDIRIGASPLIGSNPQDKLDSLLVHDGP
jgi:hypothetical protein